MPAHFEPSRWLVEKDTEGHATGIYIDGTITDPEVPGESQYAEFRINSTLLAELDTDQKVRDWLATRVDERHFHWREALATRPPAPEAIPLAEVAAILNPGGKRGEARLHVAHTLKDRGERPASAAHAEDAPVLEGPPRTVDALGRKLKADAQPAADTTAPAAPGAVTSATNPTAGGQGNAKK